MESEGADVFWMDAATYKNKFQGIRRSQREAYLRWRNYLEPKIYNN